MRHNYILLKRQISYDIRNGIILRYKKILVFTLIITVLFLFFNRKVNSYDLVSKDNIIGFWDYFIYLFRGKEEIGSLSQLDVFDIPIEWLLIHSYFLFVIGTYPKEDYVERGYQFLIRVGNKWYWWLSKGVYIIVSVLFYYFSIVVIAFGFAVINSGSLQRVNIEICYSVLGMDASGISKGDIIWGACIMPVIVLITLCFIEMFLSFIASSMVAVIVLLGYLSISAYWLNQWLLGNYTMLFRVKSVSYPSGFIISCGSMMLFFTLGYFYFKQLDLIGKRKEEIA